jgi:hypothetical protein
MNRMALIDDIEFYGRAADAGEMTRPDAARALAEASSGGLTLVGAERAINDWKGMRARLEGQHADTVDSIRALRNGKPIPEHVLRHMDEENKRQMHRDV